MEELRIQKPLFGAAVQITIYEVEENPGKLILEDAYIEALRLQKIFSFFDKDSELSRLNTRRKLTVSKELKEVFAHSIEISKMTKGAYDITLGKAILQRKNKEEVKKPQCSYRDISINDRKIKLNHPDVMIDLGSIAKGYITDKIAEFLKEKGVMEGMIDARGDLLFFGNYIHVVGIQNPRSMGIIHSIKLSNQAVATSGDYMQFHETYRKSHIINQKDIISATVIADTLELADSYATALFVCDTKTRQKLIHDHNIKTLLMISPSNIKTYNGFDRHLYTEK
jgi:thiamine biosynthesis lipoprotein